MGNIENRVYSLTIQNELSIKYSPTNKSPNNSKWSAYSICQFKNSTVQRLPCNSGFSFYMQTVTEFKKSSLFFRNLGINNQKD